MTDVLKSIAKHLLRIALMALVSLEVIGSLFIDQFMFHPDYAGKTYTERTKGFVDIGTNGVRIAAVVLGPELAKKSSSVRFVPVEGADHGEIASGIGIDRYLEMVSGACEVHAGAAKAQAKTEKGGAEKAR